MSAKNSLSTNQKTVTQSGQSTLVNTSIPANSTTKNGGAASRTEEEPSQTNPIPPQATYAAVLEKGKPSRMRLNFIPPEIVNGKPAVRYRSLDVMPGINKWKSSAFGYVMGINPSFGAVEHFAQNRWGKLGFEKCFKLKSGLFLFQFDTEVHRDAMLSDGPWIFAQHPFILEAWTPTAKLERKGVERVPVWIRAPFLSLQFWNEEMFSRIGSCIGNPLYPDGATADFSRISYARLYVEVCAATELPDFVPLVDENGCEFLQRIEYEWIPPRCDHCCLFGHSNVQCKFGGNHESVVVEKEAVVRREWRQKPEPNPSKVTDSDQMEATKSSEDSIVDCIIPLPTPLGVHEMVVGNTFSALVEEPVIAEPEVLHLNTTKRILKNIVDVQNEPRSTRRGGIQQAAGRGKRFGKPRAPPPCK